jgi:hypothetical protein
MDVPVQKEWTTDDWGTPQPIIDAARVALSGILLDPFSNGWSRRRRGVDGLPRL